MRATTWALQPRDPQPLTFVALDGVLVEAQGPLAAEAREGECVRFYLRRRLDDDGPRGVAARLEACEPLATAGDLLRGALGGAPLGALRKLASGHSSRCM